MPVFLLSTVFIVSIEMTSLFQLIGATRLFLEKIVFPISPFYTEKKSFKWTGGVFSAREKGKILMTNLNT